MEKIGSQSCFKMKIIEYHDYKTLMGPCFISFSLPLLIPGVVLTVVGSYGNEHTFARFGGWHITGIVILSFATIMLIAGILLKCCFKPALSADIEQHLSPNASVISGSKNIGYEKDTDDGSKDGQKVNSNKVSPLNYAGKHNIVSTHERRHRKTSESNTMANGAIGVSVRDTYPDNRTNVHNKGRSINKTADLDLDEIESTRTIHVKQGRAHRNITDSESEQSDRRRHKDERASCTDKEPPPSYDEIQHKHLRKKRSKASLTPNEQSLSIKTETPTGAITTNVTSSIQADVTSHRNGTSQREHSSDANEESRFLPEKKKRRKKKKVKRRHSEKSEYEADIEESSKPELPELRLKPVLLHEGEPHHHHAFHVHFQTEALEEERQETVEENKSRVLARDNSSFNSEETHEDVNKPGTQAVIEVEKDKSFEEETQTQDCDRPPPNEAHLTNNEVYV